VVVVVDWIGLVGFENEGLGFDPFIFRERARRLFERERARRRNQLFLWFPIFHLRWCTVYVVLVPSFLFIG
jgi:predicted nucleic acid-binding Zn ribbon protein